MLLAVNYSLPSAELFRSGAIVVDRFKCPPWPDMIAEAEKLAQVTVHFEFQAGPGLTAQTDWAATQAWLARTPTTYVNTHLNPRPQDFPGLPVDTTDPVQAERVYAQLYADVQALTAQFGPERVIVENIPYYATQGDLLRPASEPAIINRLVEETGCGLLLDISHARIAARYLGLDECDYMNSLPVRRLRELHFTGIQELDGLPMDHLPIQASDWQALEWVLDRIRAGAWARPGMLAFEYSGLGKWFTEHSDPAVIAAQVPRLYDMVHNV